MAAVLIGGVDRNMAASVVGIVLLAAGLRGWWEGSGRLLGLASLVSSRRCPGADAVPDVAAAPGSAEDPDADAR
jgi:hypothetical protein